MQKDTIEKTDRRVTQSLQAIVSRVRRNLGKIDHIIKAETYELRLEIGRDLMQAQELCKSQKLSFKRWLGDNFELSETEAYNAIRIAKSSAGGAKFSSVTEHLRHHNPNYARPRQPVNNGEPAAEPAAVNKILGGIDTGIFFERAKTASKELQLKKHMALELVDAGFRALSVKAHADKGGSDDAMRRLSEVRKALKNAIDDEVIDF